MVGYNFVTGTGGLLEMGGSKVYLTADAQVNRSAYEALRAGTVWSAFTITRPGRLSAWSAHRATTRAKMVNTLSNPLPGTYMNKLISGTLTPD